MCMILFVCRVFVLNVLFLNSCVFLSCNLLILKCGFGLSGFEKV